MARQRLGTRPDAKMRKFKDDDDAVWDEFLALARERGTTASEVLRTEYRRWMARERRKVAREEVAS